MCNKYIGPYKDVGPLYIEYKKSLWYTLYNSINMMFMQIYPYGGNYKWNS